MSERIYTPKEVANKFNSIVRPLLVSIANICIIVSLFALLWYTSGTVMLILLVILLPVLVLINSFKRKLRAWGKQNRQSKGQLIKTINHSLGGIKETKVIGCENYFFVVIALFVFAMLRNLLKSVNVMKWA